MKESSGGPEAVTSTLRSRRLFARARARVLFPFLSSSLHSSPLLFLSARALSALFDAARL